MSNLLEVSSPLWLVLAAFALPFIVGSHPLELRKALRRGMQMLVRATANASRLAKKAVLIGMGLCGIVARAPSSARVKHVARRAIYLVDVLQRSSRYPHSS